MEKIKIKDNANYTAYSSDEYKEIIKEKQNEMIEHLCKLQEEMETLQYDISVTVENIKKYKEMLRGRPFKHKGTIFQVGDKVKDMYNNTVKEYE